ncbi:MAG: PQQ-dependent sugar dehydrogenase [Actinobacteria bacterium]|nr:PQQ-dependent sugar dehydrogenase [Actinomycetota bacterium]
MRLITFGLVSLASLALTACASGSPVAGPVPATPSTDPPAVTVAADQATALITPWGLVRLPDGSALVSERDTGRIVQVAADRSVSEVTRIAETAASGEGGLMGLAVDPTGTWLYAYVTTADDNRVVRLRLDDPDAPREEIVTGIPKAETHNGGRIAFGPDGMLYVATGDTRVDDLAQDPTSLAGKILRVDPEGGVPDDNPFPGSPVWSLGHRNVQGLAFDSRGRLWATEFGEKDADELNLIEAGGNYGWPLVEGTGTDPAYINPQAQWTPTSLASPSGLAIIDDVAYVASLRGEVLWQVPLVDGRAGEPIALDLGDLGRLRTVEAMPDGSLWLMTSNTDGRGDPRAGDDRILVLKVAA